MNEVLPVGSLEITIKTGMRTDIPILSRLDTEAVEPWDSERFNDYFNFSKNRYAIFAMAGTVEVGYLMFDIKDKKRIFIDRLVVVEKYRRRRVANQLVGYLLGKAPKILTVESVIALVGLEEQELPMLNFFKNLHLDKVFLVEHPESPGTINFVKTIREPKKKGKKT